MPRPGLGGSRRTFRGRLLAAALGFAAVAGLDAAEAPASVSVNATSDAKSVRLYGVGSGRFEVVAEPGPEGVRLAEIVNAAWIEWSAPLRLPARLPTAITVRLIPEASWEFAQSPYRVAAEASGVVTVWIRGGGVPGAGQERGWLTAAAEGALRRKAFLVGLDPGKADAPKWLAAAAAEAALIAGRPAMLDAWQSEIARRGGVVPLREVLLWDHATAEANAARSQAAYGIWLWLRDESGKSQAWDRFVSALIGGESAGVALVREYARLTPRPREAREWELAWRVAAGRFAAARTTPAMTAVETRRRLERLARLVVLDARTGEERVVPAWGEWSSRDEIWPNAVRSERQRMLESDFNRLHPFYRNAAGSLGRAWAALAEGKETAWREASVEWAQDMQDGRALEETSRRLLDESGGS